jgi:hypothetical protein
MPLEPASTRSSFSNAATLREDTDFIPRGGDQLLHHLALGHMPLQLRRAPFERLLELTVLDSFGEHANVGLRLDPS